MTNDQFKYGVGGLLIGGVVVWLFMSSTGTANFRGMMGQRYATENNMPMSGIMDAHFIEQMIPHHEDAITMAELGAGPHATADTDAQQCQRNHRRQSAAFRALLLFLHAAAGDP